jgi:hypothetical protein
VRAERDAELLVEIRRVHHDREIGRGLYGARKVWTTCAAKVTPSPAAPWNG